VPGQDPKALLRSGDFESCRTALMDQVRNAPGDAKLRAFLFQYLLVEGDLDRAVKQLDMLGTLEESTLDLVTDYRAALSAEEVRAEVMAGKRAPAIMGEPADWIAKLVEALRLDAAGAHAEAFELREEAFAAAPIRKGTLDETEFSWISDADQRFGPLLEMVLNGEYHWVPFDIIESLTFEAPRDLRDMVWSVGILTLVNGGSWPVFIPARYPGSDIRAGGEPQHALAQRTDWTALHGEHYSGIGQRMLATDVDDFPLLDVRQITFASEESAEPDLTEPDAQHGG